CEIFLDGEVWTLRDLGSRNGTFVDEVQVTRDYPLRDRQLIRIGGAVFQFTTELGPATVGADLETAIGTESDGERDRTPAIESDSNILHRAKESRYAIATLTEQRARDLASGIRHLYQ